MTPSKKVFSTFSKYKQVLGEQLPSTIYKFRDWGERFHPSILTEQTLWLASPYTLNDEFDIRTKITVNRDEINTPEFDNTLKNSIKSEYPHLDSREFCNILLATYKSIYSDPVKYFQDRNEQLRKSDFFKKIGILSMSLEVNNKHLWKKYANYFKGFCVGFDTIKLAKHTYQNCLIRKVVYDENPPLLTFMPDDSDTFFYTKETKWSEEKEIRFVNLNIKNEKKRTISFPKDSIKTVHLGKEISEDHRSAIITILKEKYKSRVTLYEIHEKDGILGEQEILY